jgi:hypothetical protein
MMPFLSLPNELIHQISKLLKRADLNALVQTNSQLYSMFNRSLYHLVGKFGGSLALLWAATHGQPDTTKTALTEKANLSNEDNIQASFLFAVENGRCKIPMLLIGNGANINAQHEHFGYVLQLASWLGDWEMMMLQTFQQNSYFPSFTPSKLSVRDSTFYTTLQKISKIYRKKLEIS